MNVSYDLHDREFIPNGLPARVHISYGELWEGEVVCLAQGDLDVDPRLDLRLSVQPEPRSSE